MPVSPALPGYRAPSGAVDTELRVQMLREHPSGVPHLEIALWRRSPCDVSPQAFHPTAEPVCLQAQFGPALLRAIQRALEDAA